MDRLGPANTTLNASMTRRIAHGFIAGTAKLRLWPASRLPNCLLGESHWCWRSFRIGMRGRQPMTAPAQKNASGRSKPATGCVPHEWRWQQALTRGQQPIDRLANRQQSMTKQQANALRNVILADGVACSVAPGAGPRLYRSVTVWKRHKAASEAAHRQATEWMERHHGYGRKPRSPLDIMIDRACGLP